MTLDVLFAGLATGSIFGLLALGYHVTFIVAGTVNFSQGASLMIGAVLLYELHVHAGLPAWVAVPLVLLLCALLGWLVELVGWVVLPARICPEKSLIASRRSPLAWT